MPFVDWSSTPVIGTVNSANPDAVDDVTRCYEYGPVTQEDISEGWDTYQWEAYKSGDNVWYWNRELGGMEKVAFSGASNLTHMSMTFDQLGHLSIAWTDGGNVYLWWYDPVAASQVTTTLCLGKKPFIFLDDRRIRLIDGGDTDMILVYQRANTAYMRLQRDRFLIEYDTPLVDVNGLRLTNAGFTEQLRFQVNYVYE